MAFFDEIARRSGQLIHFTSMATGKSVSFPAFITSFSDNYNIGWSGESSFGRVDPVKHYQSTTRSISAAFDILARNKDIAVDNFKKYTELIKMTYPAYGEQIGNNPNVRTIKASPLLRIKYSNYIFSEDNPIGLLGCFQGVIFQPNFEAGHFLDGAGGGDPVMIPIAYSLSFNFEPLHEKVLGSNATTGEWLGGQGFPYQQGGLTSRVVQPASPGSVLNN